MSLDAKQLSTEIIARFDELNENFDPNNLPDYLDEMSKVINKYLMDFADVSIVWKAQTTTTPPVQDAIQATTGKLLGIAISMKKSDCQNVDPADSPRQLKNLFSNKISIAMSAATVTALKGTPYSQATKYTLGDIVTKETSYYQCIVHEIPAGSSWKDEDWNEIGTYNPLESWNIVSVPLSTADPSYSTKLYVLNTVFSFDFGSGIKGYDDEGRPIIRDYKENMKEFCDNFIDKITTFKNVTTPSVTTASQHVLSGVTYVSTTSTLDEIS